MLSIVMNTAIEQGDTFEENSCSLIHLSTSELLYAPKENQTHLFFFRFFCLKQVPWVKFFSQEMCFFINQPCREL